MGEKLLKISGFILGIILIIEVGLIGFFDFSKNFSARFGWQDFQLFFENCSRGLIEKTIKTAGWLDKNFKTNYLQISQTGYIINEKGEILEDWTEFGWGGPAIFKNFKIYSPVKKAKPILETKSLEKVQCPELSSPLESCEAYVPGLKTQNFSPEPKFSCQPENCQSETRAITLINESSDLDGKEDIIFCRWRDLTTCEVFENCDNWTIESSLQGFHRIALTVMDKAGCYSTMIKDTLLK